MTTLLSMEDVNFIRGSGERWSTDLNALYGRCGSNGHATPEDYVFLATHGGEAVAGVRLALESGVVVLRGMQIEPEFQRKGIGTELLKLLNDHVHEKKYSPVYCLPYAHLESFYGQIGFKKISSAEAPKFLQERLKGYQMKNSDQFIMKKILA